MKFKQEMEKTETQCFALEMQCSEVPHSQDVPQLSDRDLQR